MTQDRNTIYSGGLAAWRLRLALACLIGSLASPAPAQDALPSVSDYRLPSGPATPRPRAQGPVDPENPEASTPRLVRPAEAAPQPAATAAAPTRRASPAASLAPTATASPPARPSARAPAAQASPQANASPTRSAARPATPAATPSPDARPQASPATTAAVPTPPTVPPTVPQAAPPTAAPAALPTAPGPEWRVHSAAERMAWWRSPWLAGLALVGGLALAFLLGLAWRRRKAGQAAAIAEAPASAPPLPAAGPQAQPELDLLTVMAEPLPAPPPPAPRGAAPRPALGLHVNPLEVELAARRMSATLMNAVLHYELVIRNTGSTAIGPVTVGGDMIGAHASLPDRAQLEMSAQEIAPLHRLPQLAAGQSATLTGEFKLPLTEITPIRSGSAALFIPLARFHVEAARPGAPPLVANSAFVIGEDQDRPGAALRPFRLDLGPRLYSRIGQRELAMIA